jgi:hypothetical protein
VVDCQVSEPVPAQDPARGVKPAAENMPVVATIHYS